MGLVAWRPVQDREKKAKAQIGKATIETNEDFALDPIYLFTLPENGTVLPVPVLFRSVRLRSPETGWKITVWARCMKLPCLWYSQKVLVALRARSAVYVSCLIWENPNRAQDIRIPKIRTNGIIGMKSRHLSLMLFSPFISSSSSLHVAPLSSVQFGFWAAVSNIPRDTTNKLHKYEPQKCGSAVQIHEHRVSLSIESAKPL